MSDVVSADQGPHLLVLAAGLATTVQDFGRVGYQRLGVPVSGALDRLALAAANTVVGNDADAAGLECLYQGPTVVVAATSVRLAVGGAGAHLEIGAPDGGAAARIGAQESVTARRGDRVRVVLSGPSISGYLAVEGGIAVPPVMGSRSTYVRACLGGLEGRALRAGDAVPLERAETSERDELQLTDLGPDLAPELDLAPRHVVRVVLGPQDDRFAPDAIEALRTGRFKVLPASDRMGLRLAGPVLQHVRGADIASDGIAPGAVQVPGSGQPIIMLADRQTTGGYTKIATVASADVPALGRLGPGANLRFRIISVEEAQAARREQDAAIARWPAALTAVRDPGAIARRLWEQNLISGVVGG